MSTRRIEETPSTDSARKCLSIRPRREQDATGFLPEARRHKAKVQAVFVDGIKAKVVIPNSEFTTQASTTPAAGALLGEHGRHNGACSDELSPHKGLICRAPQQDILQVI